MKKTIYTYKYILKVHIYVYTYSFNNEKKVWWWKKKEILKKKKLKKDTWVNSILSRRSERIYTQVLKVYVIPISLFSFIYICEHILRFVKKKNKNLCIWPDSGNFFMRKNSTFEDFTFFISSFGCTVYNFFLTLMHIRLPSFWVIGCIKIFFFVFNIIQFGKYLLFSFKLYLEIKASLKP